MTPMDPTSSPAPKRTRKPLEAYRPDEQAIIRWLERGQGRELTEQEVHLALGQARHIGTLEEPDERHSKSLSGIDPRSDVRSGGLRPDPRRIAG
jgi:hypothetical protein